MYELSSGYLRDNFGINVHVFFGVRYYHEGIVVGDVVNCRMFLKSQLLNIFNISKIHTSTLPHHFMSEITLHTAQLQKSYSAKIDDFLGEFRVVYNYIHSIYYIFFDRYTIRLFFLCGSVEVWK